MSVDLIEPIADIVVAADAPDDGNSIDLFAQFDDPFTTGQVATLEIASPGSAASFPIELLLFDQEGAGAPIAVERFSSLVNAGAFDNLIINRGQPGFVIQAGQFVLNPEIPAVEPVPGLAELPTITGQPSPERSNTAGTIAFALSGNPANPDSATSQFFFNLGDNSSLDPEFTVFGQLLSDEDTGTVSAIANDPVFAPFQGNAGFIDFNAGGLTIGDLILFSSITIAPQDELTFTAVSSDPDLVTPNIEGGNLSLEFSDTQGGTAEITVTATNLLGDTSTDTFAVTVQEPADPAAIVVDTLADEDDGIEVGGTSLREALAAIAPEGTITFAPGLTGTIALTGGELIVDRPLTVDGATNDITVNAQGSSRAFNVNDGDDETAIAVGLLGLTVTGGSTSSLGGGIFNAEDLLLAGSTVAGNSADAGGGIFNGPSATATLTNSTVSGNAAGNGGGIFNDSYATAALTNSTVSGNAADYGGGIFGDNSTAILTNSTVSGNSGNTSGGGITNNNSTANLTNSTVSGNSAATGGGILNNSGGSASLVNSTVSGNSAATGGGILNATDADTLSVTNALIAGNRATEAGGEVANNSGIVNVGAGNLFGDSTQTDAEAFSGFVPSTSDLNFTATADGTIPTALEDILEITLAANGGPTQTLALVTGSPAIDAGVDNGVTTDQRGVARAANAVDIGAFEATVAAADFSLDTDGDDNTDALTDGLNVLRVLLEAPVDAIALSPDAPEGTDPASVFADIEIAVAAGLLDSDSSGSTEALTDGLNILRVLLNAPVESIVVGDSAPPDLSQQDVAGAIAALL